jgi:Cdc6-like AAA superfamily ATPase
MRTARKPMTDEDWQALRDEVLDLFSPGAPIDEVALFSGRQEQIQRLRDALISKGRHAAVFGERGVGKTSLTKIFHLGRQIPQRIHHIYVQCLVHDDFEAIWRKAFRRIKFTIDGKDIWASDLVEGHKIDADKIEIVLSDFGKNDLPIIVFDEFDRMKDHSVKTLMSETIKQLSNSPTTAMIVVVGVADAIPELIAEHQSISRALVQIKMPRMKMEELRDIVSTRLHRTPLIISDDALWRIAFLASGLPFYAHAFGQAAALVSIERKEFRISEQDVDDAIPNSFSDLDQTLIDAYVKAIVETRKGNIFKEVLAACALADQDELGRFSAASVEAPLSAIVGKETKIPAFAFHLNELCGKDRGLILKKSGKLGSFRFRFVEPMIQPYIIMKSLETKISGNDILERFAIHRQRVLSI